jgi:hypothetical protein
MRIEVKEGAGQYELARTAGVTAGPSLVPDVTDSGFPAVHSTPGRYRVVSVSGYIDETLLATAPAK